MTASRCVVIALLFMLCCGVSRARPPSSATTAKPAPPIAIDYDVRRMPSGDRYEITLRFKGDRSGRSTLHIPTQWAGATHVERGFERLEVLKPDARLEDTGDPHVKYIVHRPDAMVTVRYVLKQISDGAPSVTGPTQFVPVLQPTYFEWVGWTTWIIPMAHNDSRIRVHVRFMDLPSDWTFASSFGLDPAAVDFDGSMDRFQAALFIGGDFRLRSRAARGGPVITAVRGDWSFGDNAFADRVAKIVNGERSFWNDGTQRYYLVALLPITAPPGFQSSKGTGLTQAFLTFVTGNQSLANLDFLWGHEYFHVWNNRELGSFSEPQSRLYWFSEGFTDYYTWLLQLRFGLITLEQYARAFDMAIQFLAESPEAHASNDEVVKRFFTDDTIGRLPYARGMLLAAQWDDRIRAASSGEHSLDDAMRTLRDEHRRGIAVLDAPRIVRVMKSYGVADPAADIDQQIEHGELPRLAENELTSCISVTDATEPRVDIGFDLAGSTKGGPIVGVDPDGPAYAAGLRNGQQLRTFRSVDRTRHIVEAGFEATSSGEITTVSYPAHGRPLTRQHVAMRTGLDEANHRRCLDVLGVR